MIIEQLQIESTTTGGNSRRSTDAQALLDSITRGQFVVGLAILNSVMTVTKPLSKILQSSTNDLMIALTIVKIVVDQLRQWRASNDRFQCIFEQAQSLCEHEIGMPRANANRRQMKRRIRTSKQRKNTIESLYSIHSWTPCSNKWMIAFKNQRKQS